MIIVTLTMYEQSGISMRASNSETRLFSSKQKAEKWLEKNHFIYTKNASSDKAEYEWVHINDEPWKYIDVDISDIVLNDNSESIFKHLKKEPAPWLKATREEAYNAGRIAGMIDRIKAFQDEFKNDEANALKEKLYIEYTDSEIANAIEYRESLNW